MPAEHGVSLPLSGPDRRVQHNALQRQVPPYICDAATADNAKFSKERFYA